MLILSEQIFQDQIHPKQVDRARRRESKFPSNEESIQRIQIRICGVGPIKIGRAKPQDKGGWHTGIPRRGAGLFARIL